ncbi:MAG: FGGY-family carbohydrate kinase [Desulfobacterales bacterium]|nr:FGGY-family carbohydrate kinase [Desulfobacterales bacterium]
MSNQSSTYILTYDIGTTSAKTCLFTLGEKLVLVAAEAVGYELITTPDGGAEQRADDWWNALCQGTKTVLEQTGCQGKDISAISFCCQMQALILADKDGVPVRNPMGYMDGRAIQEFKTGFTIGWPKIEGLNAFKLLPSLIVTGGAAATAKDPLWKYHWVRQNEPSCFDRAVHWLDVRDYLAFKCTGRACMTRDSAHLTFLYDTRKGKEKWSSALCRIFNVDASLLPPVENALDKAGTLCTSAASDLGLEPEIPVFNGGGDTSMISMGSGCLDLNDTHIYTGTSGWVIANVDRRMVDVRHFIAAIAGALPGQYNYIAEQETSGLCLQWVKDHLALDAIGVYWNNSQMPKMDDDALYGLMNQKVLEIEPGSGGLIFTPWLHGNRAPREDALVRGMFFNIGLHTGKRAMIRSVLEGMAFHKRWMLEAVEKKVGSVPVLRFAGGGARSEVLCQILADVLNKEIQVPVSPQNVGATGAAIVCGMGLGIIESAQDAKSLIEVKSVYQPEKKNRQVYDRMFKVFKKLYDRNKKLFHSLNQQ